MALVSFRSCSNTFMASAVGRTNSLIFRRLASRCTSCITGNLLYAPLPITSWRHFQGMFSSTESGVCPKLSRNFLDGFFLRLRISPWSMITSCSYVLPSISREPKVNLSKCIRLLGRCLHALFFEVTAEKADQRCSTLWLPQCGQVVFTLSCSAMVNIFENVFLQA